MILTDRIGIGGVKSAPKVILPAHVGHIKVKANDGTVDQQTIEKLTVIVKPHPLIKRGAALYWDGDAYVIGDNIQKRRRGQRTHHLTLEIRQVSG